MTVYDCTPTASIERLVEYRCGIYGEVYYPIAACKEDGTVLYKFDHQRRWN